MATLVRIAPTKHEIPMSSTPRAMQALTVSITFALMVPAGMSAQVNEAAAESDRLQYLDVFEMEVAADPQISPDGSQIVYVRRGFDIMTDQSRTALWTLASDGTNHRALTDGNSGVGSPSWSRRRVRNSRSAAAPLRLLLAPVIVCITVDSFAVTRDGPRFEVAALTD